MQSQNRYGRIELGPGNHVDRDRGAGDQGNHQRGTEQEHRLVDAVDAVGQALVVVAGRPGEDREGRPHDQAGNQQQHLGDPE